MRRVSYWPAVPMNLRPIQFGCIGVIDKLTKDRRMLLDCFDVRFPVPLLYRSGELHRHVGFLNDIDVIEVDAVYDERPEHKHHVVEHRKKLIAATGWVEDDLVGHTLWPAIDADACLYEWFGEPDDPMFKAITREWMLAGVTLHESDPGVWTEVTPAYVE